MYWTKKITKTGINLEKAEKYYKATFIGDFCLPAKGGGWVNSPVAIFYQPNPELEKGHTHYFGLLIDPVIDRIMITKGDGAFSQPIDAVIADNGEVIWSSYRHDYEISEDESVMIDGGRDYLRSSATGKFVKLAVVGDHLAVIDGSITTPIEVRDGKQKPREEGNDREAVSPPKGSRRTTSQDKGGQDS